MELKTLLERILKQSGNIRWIRLLYMNPNRLTTDLLKLMRDSAKLCKYIDIPIQHINGRILRLMNRKTSGSQIMKLIDEARKIIPGVALRTSVITGFPSETDREFKELLDFIEQARFERLGAFIYSREEGTPAYGMQGQIPLKVKSERFNMIMSSQQKISQEINKKLLGQTLEVLIDEAGEGYYLGRTQYDAPEVDGSVYVNSRQALRPGDFVRSRITDTLEYDLVGEAVK
jgi:ribosomal protein S12 methylthiotransferase